MYSWPFNRKPCLEDLFCRGGLKLHIKFIPCPMLSGQKIEFENYSYIYYAKFKKANEMGMETGFILMMDAA